MAKIRHCMFSLVFLAACGGIDDQPVALDGKGDMFWNGNKKAGASCVDTEECDNNGGLVCRPDPVSGNRVCGEPEACECAGRDRTFSEGEVGFGPDHQYSSPHALVCQRLDSGACGFVRVYDFLIKELTPEVCVKPYCIATGAGWCWLTPEEEASVKRDSQACVCTDYELGSAYVGRTMCVPYIPWP